jgi:hypothetical protein
MAPKDIAEWMELGMRLQAAGPEKYDQVVTSLRRVVDAQEQISEHDWQLMFRGRPTKRYQA